MSSEKKTAKSPRSHRPRGEYPAAAIAGLSGRVFPREAAVALLVGSGLSNAEAAARLGLRSGSVRAYLARVYGKTGLGSRLQIAVRLAQFE